MYESFKKYLRDTNLFFPEDKIILTVSGGVDSMVMLYLFQKMEYTFVVAHCNFHLRGEESDGDEKFVREYCDKNNLKVFVKHFDTRGYASENGISIEMAARNLRYDWFSQLLKELSFTWIATAHHQDDLLETMLINLSRGTGIRGLTGIAVKSGNIVRPMLFVNRHQILQFSERENIPFRNDSSNDDIYFQRNRIRHIILPAFDKLNPLFRKNALRTAGILDDTETIFKQKIEEEKRNIFEYEGQSVHIPIRSLEKLNPLSTYLFEFLRPYGFNSIQVDEICQSFYSEAGKCFYSSSHRLVKDRLDLILTGRVNLVSDRFYIEKDVSVISTPVSLNMDVINIDSAFVLSRNSDVVDLDMDLLNFPLILKRWEGGEYFRPLGMSGFKKLSDFFTDEKMSIPEKENIWILYSGKNIVWVIGKRVDDRYKITAQTKKVLRITINPGSLSV
ncbi:MAG: tRNA lysidine(34) synthetase TilS [Prolixibacteraceae bacterium]|nr:tRNA lysidine(34) synthetase TilS [Prolixibacteraceae bacterium]